MIVVTEINKRLLATEVTFKILKESGEEVSSGVKRVFGSKRSYKSFLKNGLGLGFIIDKPIIADDCKYRRSFKITRDDISLKWWLFQNSQFVSHISFLWHWKNFFFLLKYPFYKSRNRWSDKFSGYSFTEYDCIPTGWKKAFGKEFSRELKKAIKLDKCKKTFRWDQIKEKYGELRLYAHGYGDNVEKLLDKYELLSQGYCIWCGKPARYISRHRWIELYCEECFDGQFKDNAYKEECRLTKKDIPELSRFKNGQEIKVDIKKEYNVDLEKMWGLDE